MRYVIWILAFLLLISTVAAEPCVTFFTGEGCPHCARVEPFIEDLENVTVQHYEVYNNRSNLPLLRQHFDAYNVPTSQRSVPVFFVGDTYLLGDGPISAHLEDELDEGDNCALPTNPTTGEANGVDPEQQLEELGFLTLIGFALVDSINPCAIAVLVLLLSALLAAGSKKRALQAGMAFTASIYLSYFLFGIGLFSALQITGLAYWFGRIVGFLAIILGLMNLKDFFWYGKGFVTEIPRSWRPTMKRLIKSVTSIPGAFAMGFVVSLFELPCTGGPYLVILGLLAERTTQAQAIRILLLYNVFFILPLLVITALVWKGYTTVERASEWREKNIRVLHLIAGLVMLILGILLVLGIV